MSVRRCTAFVLAAALVFVQLVTAWHLATTHHHWCAEHLALEDGATAGPVPLPRPGPDAVVVATSGGNDHERCALTTACIAQGATDRVRALRRADRPLASSFRPAAIPLPRRALYRVAPKTSPPRG